VRLRCVGVAHPVWEGSAVLASHLGAKAMQCNELHHEIRWGDPVHFAIGKTASTKSAGYIIEAKWISAIPLSPLAARELSPCFDS